MACFKRHLYEEKKVSTPNNPKNEYIFLMDNNIDKKKLDEVQWKVSRDRQIKKLIYCGNFMILAPMIWLIPLGFSVAKAILSVNANGFRIWNSIKALFGRGAIFEKFWALFTRFITFKWILEPGSMTFVIALLFWLMLFLLSLREIILKYKAIYTTLDKALRYSLSCSRPKQPLEIWKTYQGSVSDSQIHHTVTQLISNANPNNIARCAYASEPYYKPLYIDGFAVKWNICKSFYRAKHRYNKFYRRFSEQTIMAQADQKYFSDKDKKLKSSCAVFGILFSSDYFLSEYNWIKKKRKHTEADMPLLKVFINLNGNNLRNCDDDNHNQINKLLARCADEWARYVLSPDYFQIITNPEEGYDLEICNIKVDQYDYKPERRSMQIPVKRFIAVPADYDSNRLPFPASLGIFDNAIPNENKTILCPGGAEHNLALQCVINHYRWQNKDTAYKYNGASIGFAENAFEQTDNREFLVGTEGLVYGITRKIMGRISNDHNDTSRLATAYHMVIFSDPNDFTEKSYIDIYGVYGYGAVATKIICCFLIDCLLNKSQKGKWIPGYGRPAQQKSIDYIIDKDKKGKKYKNVCETPTGRKWDQGDYMNHIDILQKWLNNESETSISII